MNLRRGGGALGRSACPSCRPAFSSVNCGGAPGEDRTSEQQHTPSKPAPATACWLRGSPRCSRRGALLRRQGRARAWRRRSSRSHARLFLANVRLLRARSAYFHALLNPESPWRDNGSPRSKHHRKSLEEIRGCEEDDKDAEEENRKALPVVRLQAMGPLSSEAALEAVLRFIYSGEIAVTALDGGQGEAGAAALPSQEGYSCSSSSSDVKNEGSDRRSVGGGDSGSGDVVGRAALR